ncbi:hypothetical protein G6F42_022875 [Rhizopus arrhizus]|nr:hypothetical protein G6F42_022875 [Rhizopus arrhizus]
MFNSRVLLFAIAIAAVVVSLFNAVADAAVVDTNISSVSRAEKALLEKRGRKKSSPKNYSESTKLMMITLLQ